MKIIKNLFLFSVFFTLVARSAEETTSIGMDDSHQMKASKIPDVIWNFELKNKDKNQFKVSVRNGTRIILDNYIVQPSKASSAKDEKNNFYLRMSGLDLTQPTLIIINNQSAKIKESGVTIPGLGKTIFVSYENGELRSQSGKGFFSKETQSGLSLKNNIESIKNLTEHDALVAFWKLLPVGQLSKEYTLYIESGASNQNYLDALKSIIKEKGGVIPRSKWERSVSFPDDPKALKAMSPSELEDKYARYRTAAKKSNLSPNEQERILDTMRIIDSIYYEKTKKHLFGNK